MGTPKTIEEVIGFVNGQQRHRRKTVEDHKAVANDMLGISKNLVPFTRGIRKDGIVTEFGRPNNGQFFR